MWRSVCVLIIVVGISCKYAVAEQFVVRVETRGYLDAPLSMAEPPDELLSAIEVLAIPGEWFFGKATVGKDTITVSGRLKARDDGSFCIDPISYCHEKDTGNLTWDLDGKPKKLPQGRGAETTITVELGKPCEFAKLLSKQGFADKPDGTRSKQRDVVTLSIHDGDR